MANGHAGATGGLPTTGSRPGYAILAEDGIEALKIDRLCARLGGHEGQLLLALHRHGRIPRRASSKRGHNCAIDDRRHFDEVGDLPPRERLSRMMACTGERRAIGRWSARCANGRGPTPSPRASRQPTVSVLGAVRQAFVDDGFEASRSRPACERHIRDGHRLPAPLGAPPDHALTAPRVALPRRLAQPVTVSIPKGMVRSVHAPAGHDATITAEFVARVVERADGG